MLAYHFCVYVYILSCDASTKEHALSGLNLQDWNYMQCCKIKDPV